MIITLKIFFNLIFIWLGSVLTMQYLTIIVSFCRLLGLVDCLVRHLAYGSIVGHDLCKPLLTKLIIFFSGRQCNALMQRTSIFTKSLVVLIWFCQSWSYSFYFTTQKTTFENICVLCVWTGYSSRMPRNVYVSYLDPSGSFYI